MKEELISLETAKLAKERFFEIPTFYYYFEGELMRHGQDSFNHPYLQKDVNRGGNLNDDTCNVPTQSLLQKWLREVPEWPVEIIVEPFLSKSPRQYVVHLWTRGVNRYTPEVLFNTYEAALEAGLKEALKLI